MLDDEILVLCACLFALLFLDSLGYQNLGLSCLVVVFQSIYLSNRKQKEQ